MTLRAFGISFPISSVDCSGARTSSDGSTSHRIAKSVPIRRIVEMR